MPHYRWHVLGALFVFFLFYTIFISFGTRLTPLTWFFSLVVCLFSAMIPDIDSKKSKIYKLAMDGVVIAGAVLIVFYMFDNFQFMLWLLLFWLLLSGVLHIPFRHRGLIHSVWAAALYSFAIGIAGLIMANSFVPGLFAFLGYFSHLALDRKV